MKAIRLKLGEKDNPSKVKRVKRILKRLTPIVAVVSILIGLSIFLISLSGSHSVINYIFNSGILKSSNSRVNVLLLGIAGGTYQGANLTDTVVVASYNLKTNQVYLFSIPRDLWLPSLRSKVNAVYQIGLSQNNGLGFARTVMGNILGLPIHYALRIDFRGFIKAVDTLGGIDILVDHSFNDLNYPIEGKENDLCGYEEKEMDFNEDEAKKLNIDPGKKKVLISPDGKIATDSADPKKGAEYFSCRFEHLSFKAGLTHMDGKLALKYVRSRMGTNGEGSDFARSKRQQKVLEAIRDKVLSLEILSNPTKLSELIKTFGKSIDTDISIKEALEFYRLSKRLEKTYSFVLDDSKRVDLPEGKTSLLITPPASDYGGAYVLISQDDDFALIQMYVRKILSGEVTEYEQSSFPRKEEATASARTSNR